MIPLVRKTIARKMLYGKPVIVYLQPNGLIVLRRPRCRKRYTIDVNQVFDRAVPVGQLFEETLEGCAKPKRRKAR